MPRDSYLFTSDNDIISRNTVLLHHGVITLCTYTHIRKKPYKEQGMNGMQLLGSFCSCYRLLNLQGKMKHFIIISCRYIMAMLNFAHYHHHHHHHHHHHPITHHGDVNFCPLPHPWHGAIAILLLVEIHIFI